MLDGWYCRSMVTNTEEDDESHEETINYKSQYRNLKRKLKLLIYENECFQEALRSTQRRLLKASRDRSFLLDRLLQYEKVDVSSSDSEETESSDEGETSRPDTAKSRGSSVSRGLPRSRKKPDSGVNSHITAPQTSGTTPKIQSSVKKKRPPPKAPKQNSVPPLQVLGNVPLSLLSDGHMTPEEVERHLESRQTYLELVPEKAPPTVPTEMFSNDPSLDSESNEICDLETSPSNMGEDCLSVDMIPE